MEGLQPYQIPALIVAVMAVLGVLFKSVRVWARHEKTIEVHTKMLEECEKISTVTSADCVKAQEDCRKQQGRENDGIMLAISELTRKFEERQEKNHDELMKMAKSLGRIEGVVGRHNLP